MTKETTDLVRTFTEYVEGNTQLMEALMKAIPASQTQSWTIEVDYDSDGLIKNVNAKHT